MRSEPRLTVGQAAALGLLHGPAELLPVSSSAHVGLVPFLLGWRYGELPPEVRKGFEVALHAGTLVGLARVVPPPPLRVALPALLPAAVVGRLLERPIERRLGGVRATAVGLVAGAAAMVAADRSASGRRRATEATARDGWALGVAQAVALMPGLSRTGMTLAVARLRGFSRAEAATLSRQVGLPVITGATALKAVRLAQSGLERELRAPFAAGAVAALAGTLAAAPLRRVTSVWPAAVERVALAGAALIRLGGMRRGRRAGGRPSLR